MYCIVVQQDFFSLLNGTTTKHHLFQDREKILSEKTAKLGPKLIAN